MSKDLSLIKRLTTPKAEDSPYFVLYATIAIGLAMGLFPLGPLFVVALLAWVFLRNLHLISFGIFVATFFAANFLGVPPRHAIGALVLDRGPEALFTWLAQNSIMTHFRLHEYETMGALVVVAIGKVVALIAAKPLAKRYWPEHTGPSFLKGRIFTLRSFVLLPAALVVIALAAILLAPTIARNAVNSAIAQNFGEDVEVELEDVRFSLFDTQLEVTGLRVYAPANQGGKQFLGVDSLVADANLMAVLENRLEINLATASGIFLAPAILAETVSANAPPKPPTEPAIQLPAILTELSGDLRELSQKPFIQDFNELYALYREHFGEPQNAAQIRAEASQAKAAREGVAPRAPAYVEQALAEIGAPLMVVKETNISDFKLSFDGIRDQGVAAAAHYLATSLKISNLSSDPAKFGKTISLTGGLNLDTSADRAVQIAAAYSPTAAAGDAMASIEFSGVNLPIPALIAGINPGKPTLTLSLLKGADGIGDTTIAVKFPFNEDSKNAGALGLSYLQPASGSAALFGMAINAENLPLGKITAQLGALPFGIDESARATFNTYGRHGHIAYFGDSSEKIGVSLGAQGVKLLPIAGQKVLGLSSSQFCAAFNQLTATQRGNALNLRFGYDGQDGRFRLEEPRERALLDGIINVVALGAADLSDWQAVDFEGDGEIRLASLTPKGVTRTLEVQPEEDDGLANLRVRVKVGALKVKEARESVLGLPPKTFQNVWNRAVGENGLNGVLGFQLTDANGKLAPSLESGSYPTLLYALLGGFEYRLQDFIPEGKIGGAVFRSPNPFKLLPPEGWDPSRLADADGSGLANLSVRAVWDDCRLYPEDQPEKILGLPAAQVLYLWNPYVGKRSFKMEVAFRLYDAEGNFAPMPEIDFKKMFSEVASGQGLGDLLSNPGSFLEMLGKDERAKTDYMNFLRANDARVPGFSGIDGNWLKKQLEDMNKGEFKPVKIAPGSNPIDDIKKRLPKIPGR